MIWADVLRYCHVPGVFGCKQLVDQSVVESRPAISLGLVAPVASVNEIQPLKGEFREPTTGAEVFDFLAVVRVAGCVLRFALPFAISTDTAEIPKQSLPDAAAVMPVQVSPLNSGLAKVADKIGFRRAVYRVND